MWMARARCKLCSSHLNGLLFVTRFFDCHDGLFCRGIELDGSSPQRFRVLFFVPRHVGANVAGPFFYRRDVWWLHELLRAEGVGRTGHDLRQNLPRRLVFFHLKAVDHKRCDLSFHFPLHLPPLRLLPARLPLPHPRELLWSHVAQRLSAVVVFLAPPVLQRGVPLLPRRPLFLVHAHFRQRGLVRRHGSVAFFHLLEHHVQVHHNWCELSVLNGVEGAHHHGAFAATHKHVEVDRAVDSPEELVARMNHLVRRFDFLCLSLIFNAGGGGGWFI
mmetsp:Transcript_80422/g.160533  ORF Transcript_80422/g.160533 Transcript_80422/m.160533 type:complete len:274 (-) Transcript_80422:7-828(-)